MRSRCGRARSAGGPRQAEITSMASRRATSWGSPPRAAAPLNANSVRTRKARHVLVAILCALVATSARNPLSKVVTEGRAGQRVNQYPGYDQSRPSRLPRGRILESPHRHHSCRVGVDDSTRVSCWRKKWIFLGAPSPRLHHEQHGGSPLKEGLGRLPPLSRRRPSGHRKRESPWRRLRWFCGESQTLVPDLESPRGPP